MTTTLFRTAICALGFFAMTLGLTSTSAEEMTQEQLMQEYINSGDMGAEEEIETLSMKVSGNAVVRTNSFWGSVRAKWDLDINTVEQFITNMGTFTANGKANNGKNLRFSLGYDMRIFEDTLYMKLLEFQANDELVEVFPDLQMMNMLFESGIIGENWYSMVFPESEEIFSSFEQDLATPMSQSIEEDGSEIGKMLFDALQSGDIFRISKRTIRPDVVLYTLRMNKPGILKTLDQMEVINNDLPESEQIDIPSIRSLVQKSNIIVSNSINPNDPSSARVKIIFRMQDPTPTIDVIRGNLVIQMDINEEVQATPPANAIRIDE